MNFITIMSDDGPRKVNLDHVVHIAKFDDPNRLLIHLSNGGMIVVDDQKEVERIWESVANRRIDSGLGVEPGRAEHPSQRHF